MIFILIGKSFSSLIFEDDGILICFNDGHLLKSSSLNEILEDINIISSKDEQLPNAYVSIKISVDRIVICFNFSHQIKQRDSIFFTEAGIKIFTIDLHS